MAFIGFGDSFCQRHFAFVKSFYCPSWAIKNAGDLVRSPVSVDDIRSDIRLYGGTSSPRFHDTLLDEVISDCYFAFRLPHRVKPIHLNDLPTLSLDNWGASPGLPWKNYGYKNEERSCIRS